MIKFKIKSKLFEIEKDTNFANRVLALSIPSALVFIILVASQVLPATIAVVAYASIIFFNVVWLFPITFELQQIKKHLQNSEEINFDDFEITENETKEIVKAINKMHQFWTNKANKLEAKTISDTAVLDSLPDPILMIDKNGNILGANLAARNFLGNKISNKKIEEIFASNNFIKAVSKVVNQESSAENLIFYIHKDGEDQKFYAHIKQLPWVSNAVAVISIYDMSKTIKIEKMQSDFVANASHELRTPLSVISGFIETLQTSAKNDQDAQEMFLAIMQEQAKYMAVLIENLLSLSNIEMHQDLPPEEKIDIETIIYDTTHALEQKSLSKDIFFEIDIPNNIPQITADQSQIRQLVQNISDNAIKYGYKNSIITISVDLAENIPPSKDIMVAKGKAIVISINNKGEVITGEHIGRITERFYRMQTHKNQEIKGTGLGLAIAKFIVIRHKGNMLISSSKSKGTTFAIYLPIEQEAKS